MGRPPWGWYYIHGQPIQIGLRLLNSKGSPKDHLPYRNPKPITQRQRQSESKESESIDQWY